MDSRTVSGHAWFPHEVLVENKGTFTWVSIQEFASGLGTHQSTSEAGKVRRGMCCCHTLKPGFQSTTCLGVSRSPGIVSIAVINTDQKRLGEETVYFILWVLSHGHHHRGSRNGNRGHGGACLLALLSDSGSGTFLTQPRPICAERQHPPWGRPSYNNHQ